MLQYRPDIDGLRAIAVLSVLFYHLDEALLTGGYVGVDVFFVISGYLITKLIFKELSETGTFSFKNFYIRRVRRLFPALFATLALSLIAAAWLMSPTHLVDFGKSAVASILSVSNIYFWSEAGYFDSQSQLKPLLHTWSLSVEEQFYLLWPAILTGLFLLRRKGLIVGFLLVMGAASLALNLYVFAEQAELAAWFGRSDNQASFNAQSTAFYWLPFRVFEFAIGAILVWMPNIIQTRRAWLAELSFAVGLAMVLSAVTLLTDQDEFPSTAALWPCVGAALMIWAGPQHRLVWLISNRLMVAIGLVSYSLYLVHWPLIVFYKYRNATDLHSSDYTIIVIASILLAVLFYKFVEQPFRKPHSRKGRPHRRFLYGAAVAATLTIVVNAHAAWSGGWLQRYPADVVAQLSYKKGDYTEYFWRNLYAHEHGFADNGKPKVLVIGDSMAADFVNVLSEGKLSEQLDLATIAIGDNCKAAFPLNDKQYQVLYAGAAGICKQQHAKVTDNAALLAQADTIVLASFWWELYWLRYIQSTVEYINSVSDARLMVLGLKNQTSDGIWFLNKHSLSPGIDKIRTPMDPHAATINQKLRSRQNGYIYFDLLPHFCDGQGCQRVTEDGYVIVFDQAHLSEQGARFIGQQAGGASWYKLLSSPRP